MALCFQRSIPMKTTPPTSAPASVAEAAVPFQSEGGSVFAVTPALTSDPTAPSVSDYSCATARPDFRYEPGKLSFSAQATSDLGQVDMNFWSGLPPGTNRYVPLGEF